MRLAMTGGRPDRTPLMCQLSCGHIYKHAGIPPEDFWFTSQGMAEGYMRMAERYRFDGILLNVLGHNPKVRAQIESVEKIDQGHIITWKYGARTFCPPDDDPRPMDSAGFPAIIHREIADVDIESIQVPESLEDLPPYALDIIDYVIERKGDTMSIHGEIGTVFERFLLCMGSFVDGLMAIADDPDKCLEIMSKMNREVIAYSIAQCARGVDAFKLSSPLAGAGFISREMYRKFVLPFERELIDAIHSNFGTPCYIHTCGSIGDRLDLMLETGADGLECLDPPPLGSVDLAQAVKEIGDRVFIKGNLDSVNELMGHTPETVKEIARKRIEIGKHAKGFILSSACSVAPPVPPENIDALYDVVIESSGICA